MTWLGLLLRSLWRRRARSAFTILGVALALASFLTLASLSRGIEHSARESLNERGIHLLVMRRGSVEFFAAILPEALGAQIAAIPGVAAVSPELANLLGVGEDGHALVAGWPPDSFQWGELRLTAGRLPARGERAVVLGEALAEALRAGPGSDVDINLEAFPVAGIAAFGTALNRSVALMPLPDMQRLIARPGQVTLFQLRLHDPSDPAAREVVRAGVQALRPDLSVVASEDVLRGNRAVAMLGSVADALAIAAVLIAVVSVLNTLAMAVEERTQEIGVLAAIGWSRGRILRLILGEGLLLAALGSLIGAALGQGAIAVLNRLVLSQGGTHAASGASLLATALGVGLLVGAAGALWPAWRATRISPAAAMRRV